MQPEADLLDALRTDLAELTALHAPSGAEQAVIARLRDLFAPLVDAVSVDHMGNLTATREGPPGGRHIVVSAHADEIGCIGYLDHPYKNQPIKTEKEILPCLQTQAGLCRIRRRY